METQIAILFQKLVNGTATAKEIEQYYQFVKEPSLETEIKALMYVELTSHTLSEESNIERLDRVYRAVQQGISDIPKEVTKERKAKPIYIKMPIHNRLWPQIVAVAAVAFMILGVWFFSAPRHPELVSESSLANDVNPGKMGATLTLADGRRIRLNDVANGEVAKEAGISVTKTAGGQLVYDLRASTPSHPELVSGSQYNTLSTAKGETYILTLPDKSKVWLNAASSLTYAAALNENGLRKVKLKGEAFFQVSKDKAHPFVVQTDKQEVEVLGTQFNVNSYNDEPATATTLVEGSVKVRSGKRQQVIVPGQQVMNTGIDFKVAKVNLNKVMDWKDGDFNLDELDFKQAMRKISRWYDVEVIYDKNAPYDFQTVGWISRDKKLSVVLQSIASLGIVHFRVDGRKIYVTK